MRGGILHPPLMGVNVATSIQYLEFIILYHRSASSTSTDCQLLMMMSVCFVAAQIDFLLFNMILCNPVDHHTHAHKQIMLVTYYCS